MSPQTLVSGFQNSERYREAMELAVPRSGAITISGSATSGFRKPVRSEIGISIQSRPPILPGRRSGNTLLYAEVAIEAHGHFHVLPEDLPPNAPNRPTEGWRSTPTQATTSEKQAIRRSADRRFARLRPALGSLGLVDEPTQGAGFGGTGRRRNRAEPTAGLAHRRHPGRRLWSGTWLAILLFLKDQRYDCGDGRCFLLSSTSLNDHGATLRVR